MRSMRPVACLVCSVVLSAALAAFSSCFQGNVENGDTVVLSSGGGPFALQGERWNEEAGVCTAELSVDDPSDCAVAIVRASSGPMSVRLNGSTVEPKEYAGARQASVIPLMNLDQSSLTQLDRGESEASGHAISVKLEIETARWDSSDQIYVGTEGSIVDAFVIEYRVINAVVMAILAIMILYGLSLYLSKKTESYLRPFIAYASLLMFWLAMTNAPRSEALAPGFFDFVQVCGHFYVAYIPFAICVILSGYPIPQRSSFFFRWQGLLLVPLACGAVGFFTSFGFVMAVVLLLCLAYGGFALVSSGRRGSPGVNILLIGFGITMGLKIMAFFVDYGLVADSMIFFTLRKTRFLNVFVLVAIMIFLNRRFAANFRRTEDQSALLDSMVAQRTAELERQQGLRLGMMANIFHDLRTPLFSIRSCVDEIEKMSGSQSSATVLLKDRVSLLSRLIDDLFTASKLEDDDIALAEEPVDLREFLRMSVEASRPLAEELGVAVELTAESARFTWGDPHYLSRAFENLIVNAIQHTPDGGEVRIRLWCEEDSACVAIRNTGKGIAPEDIPRIFERYYHRSETTPTHTPSGLGLSIAQAIIRKHGGRIIVESEPGQGCTFTVSVPVLTDVPLGQDEGASSQTNV